MIDKKVWIQGEVLAQKFLKKNGFKILETNFKNKVGEIDIVASKDGVFHFVEVKARSSAKFGLPREAVDAFKQNKIRRVAEGYLISKNNYPARMQFDVIDVLDGKLTFIENAF